MRSLRPGWRGLTIAILETLGGGALLLALLIAVTILYPRIHAR